ncbi:MAG: VOC family protein [Solirubrobacterales bacterium]|nr:VOC family protein [Solirubrobacterales bacterium]
MDLPRMEHVSIVVRDLGAAIEFLEELGFESQGRASVEGDWVGRIIGLEGVHSDIAMMDTPDGKGRVELVEFHSPEAIEGNAGASANALGLRHLAIEVDDLKETLERLKPHGAELIGQIENYQDTYLLCYVRGPEGAIFELIESIG